MKELEKNELKSVNGGLSKVGGAIWAGAAVAETALAIGVAIAFPPAGVAVVVGLLGTQAITLAGGILAGLFD